MLLILTIDAIAVLALVWMCARRGFESTLPIAVFFMILTPNESQIRLSGLFDLTTQRVIVVVMSILYVTVGRSRTKRIMMPRFIQYLIAGLLIWMLASSITSVVPAISFKALASQFLDFFVPYYIIYRSISTLRSAHRVVYAVVGAVTVCSVFGVAEAYWNWSVASLFPYVPHRFEFLDAGLDRIGRVRSTFDHPILFGSALAMTIPFTLNTLAQVKRGTYKVVLWIALGLMFFNIYKATSRGPWVALIMSLMMLLVLSRSQMRRHIIWIAVLTVAVLLIRPGVWTSITDLYHATNDPESPQGESYEWRYALYRIAFQRLNRDVERALLGFGPDSFYYLNWQGEFHGRTVAYDTCDSSIAEMMIETGYVGCGVVIALLLASMALTLRNCRRLKSPLNELSPVLFCVLSGFLFLMTNVALFSWGQQSYILWVALALSGLYSDLVKAGMGLDHARAASLIGVNQLAMESFRDLDAPLRAG